MVDAPRTRAAIVRALRAAGRQRSGGRLLRGCAAPAVVIAVFPWIDAGDPMGARIRLVLGVGLAAVVVFVVVWSALGRRVRDADRVLAQAEEGWGISGGVLRAHARGPDRLGDDAIGRALDARARAHGESVVAAAEPLGRLRIVGFPRVSCGAVTVAVLVVLVSTVSAPALVARGYQRLIDPLGDHPPYTRVRLAIDRDVLSDPLFVGDAVVVRAAATAPGLDSVSLELDSGQLVPMRGVDGGVTFEAAVEVGGEAVGLRAVSGDVRTRWLMLDPIDAPRVLAVDAEVRPPAYAAGVAMRSSVTVAEGEAIRIDAVMDSTVVLGVRTSSQVTDIVGGDDAEIAWRGVDRGVEIEIPVLASSPSAVRLALMGADGAGPSAIDLVIRGRADLPPALAFLGDVAEGGAFVLAPGEERSVRAAAQDDLALVDPGIEILVLRDGDELAVEGATVSRLGPARAIAGLRLAADVFGDGASGGLVLVFRASDHFPGREGAELRLPVRVLSASEHREQRLAELDIDRLTEALDALSGAESAQELDAVLEEISKRDVLVDTDERAAARADQARARVQEAEGQREQGAALDSVRSDAADESQSVRTMSRLRSLVERIVSASIAQRKIADAHAEANPGSPEVQEALAEALAGVLDELEALAQPLVEPAMRTERLREARGELRVLRGDLRNTLEDAAELDGAPEAAERARDWAQTALYTQLQPVFDAEDAGALTRACSAVQLELERVAGAFDFDAVAQDLLEAMRVVVGRIAGEAEAPMPQAGASALLIARRVRMSGALEDMRASALAGRAGDAGAARDFAESAARALEDLLDAPADAQQQGVMGAGADAPLRLAPPPAAPEMTDGEAGPGAVDGQDQLARNRWSQGPPAVEGPSGSAPEARADAGEGGDAQTDAAESSGEGEGEGGSGGAMSVGGNAIDAELQEAAREFEPATLRLAAGSVRTTRAERAEGALEDDLGAQRLARVPERYRAIVAAYLRALDESLGANSGTNQASEPTGREIEEER